MKAFVALFASMAALSTVTAQKFGGGNFKDETTESAPYKVVKGN